MFRNQDATPYIIVTILSALAVLGILIVGIGNPFGTIQEVSVRALARLVAGEQVQALTIQGDEVEARLNDGSRVRASIAEYDSLAEALDEFGVSAQQIEEVGVSRGTDTGRTSLENFIFRAFPFFLPAALVMVTAAIIGLTVSQRQP